MATRKRKSEVTGDMLEPLVIKGSHLTITKWPDGRTTLEWDDSKLLDEVKSAVAEHEAKILADSDKPKRARIKGKFAPDDKLTPVVNEAWVGGKAPPKKVATKAAPKKKATPKTGG